MTQEQETLIWSCIEKADNCLSPCISDGYNEGEMYGACVKLMKKLEEKYKRDIEKADKWDKVQEILQGYGLTIHYPDGKSIQIIEQEK